jgi:hypothetical protein
MKLFEDVLLSKVCQKVIHLSTFVSQVEVGLGLAWLPLAAHIHTMDGQ